MKKNIITIIATALFLVSCGGRTAQEIQADIQEAVLVNVQAVSEQSVEQLTELTGNIVAYRVNHIIPTIPGRIDAINVEVGDRVRAGQLLVRMDRTNLLQTQLQLDNVERELARVTDLHKAGGVTQQQVDQLTSQAEVLREVVRNMEENTDLLSPISGIVTARNFDSRNLFGGGMPILTIMQLSPVKVVVNISEMHFARVQRGMNVRVRFDAHPDRYFTGRVNLIHPTIDPMTRTFRVEITIPNADLLIRPGMFARVELNFGDMDRIKIPDVAVVRQPGTGIRSVFVIENGTAVRREVELGRQIGNEFEVISGLNHGDVVVTAGQARLLDGTAVRLR